MYVSDLITDLAVVTIWPPLGPRIKSVFVKLHFSTVLLPYLGYFKINNFKTIAQIKKF